MTRGLDSVQGRVAVVTGAASGIGRATARLLAAQGAALALADIDEGGLAEVADELRLAGASVAFRTTDVADPRQVRAFAELVEESLGVAELLVNSAGIVVYGDFLATTAEDWELLLDVNLKGAANVCRAFLPAIVARGRGGWVVNIASAAAFATPAGLSAYGATKHALAGFSDGLRVELAEHQVGVTVVCPGFVDTPIAAHARLRGHPNEDAERRRIAAFLRGRGLSAERVAARIVRAAERGESLVPVGLEAHVLHVLARFAPGGLPWLLGAARRMAVRLRQQG